MKNLKLTPDLENAILASIRAGGYPHVAAAAWGITEPVFDDWLRRGRQRRGREPYRSFLRKVEQAKAQARLKAEMAAMENDPRFWLKNGPGRDVPGKPGWAAMVRPILTANQQTINLFTSPDFLQFMATLRAVLAPFPEALNAVTTAIESPQPDLIELSPKTAEAQEK
jgi:hypothetical protein